MFFIELYMFLIEIFFQIDREGVKTEASIDDIVKIVEELTRIH